MGLLLIEYLASPYWAGITRAKLHALVRIVITVLISYPLPGFSFSLGTSAVCKLTRAPSTEQIIETRGQIRTQISTTQ